MNIERNITRFTFNHVYDTYKKFFEVADLRKEYDNLVPPLRDDLDFIYDQLESNVWKFSFDKTPK